MTGIVRWQWVLFEDLSAWEVYEILKARAEVFVVEQDCAYQDIDDLDKSAWHLLAWRQDKDRQALVAYLRVVFPGKKYPEPSIGRVLTVLSARGTGLGRQLTERALVHVQHEYPGQSVRISAQRRLKNFYADFNFETVSEPYDEDGIPHVEMLRGGV